MKSWMWILIAAMGGFFLYEKFANPSPASAPSPAASGPLPQVSSNPLAAYTSNAQSVLSGAGSILSGSSSVINSAKNLFGSDATVPTNTELDGLVNDIYGDSPDITDSGD